GWCDTMYAVDPAVVRANAVHMSTAQIVERVDSLDGAPHWVTISGGNPALHELGPLVASLRSNGYHVATETQGSVWRPWLATVDRLTVSPKPPRSGMATVKHRAQLEDFM